MCSYLIKNNLPFEMAFPCKQYELFIKIFILSSSGFFGTITFSFDGLLCSLISYLGADAKHDPIIFFIYNNVLKSSTKTKLTR